MEVVLKKDLDKLGFKGDVIKVANGHYRNFLFPQGYAVAASAQAKKDAEAKRQKELMRREQVAANAKAIASQLEGVKLTFTEKVTESGHLYGSVDANSIVSALRSQAKLDIDKSHVKLDKHIKDTGEYPVIIILNEDTEVEIKVVVVAQ